MLNDYWTAARPSHWIKNLFVLAPLVFAQRLDRPRDILLVLATFALFCLLASGIYLINDAIDAPRDRSHPFKRNRPVAAGR
ncbi:MAG: decaprenyl-phosphate phosphoribosyltransferase, partial [Chloroflexi bacterium]|nr:decaprenyl-phosphate phosphoribosyltransferase [Chloroflexota bacterium]